MAAYVFPRRKPSIPTTITIGTPEPELPSWVPPAGLANSYFNNVLKSDGTYQIADTTINPDFFAPDGSPSPYPLIMHGGSGFEGTWDAQSGGALAPDLGDLGSLLFYGGGHSLWDGTNLTRLDIATGVFSNYIDSIYSGLSYSIVGGTVAAGTGTVTTTDSLDTNPGPSNPTGIVDRVGYAGQYIKTGDGVEIPGTDADPAANTVWIPYPIHSNAGIHVVPASGGGGPKGTLVLIGHTQTDIAVSYPDSGIYLCDLDTRIWDFWAAGLGQTYSYPGLEWDSVNNIMWYIRVSGTPVALKVPTREKHITSGPAIDQSAAYVANACYMPDRQLMVTVRIQGSSVNSVWTQAQLTSTNGNRFTSAIAVSNSLNGARHRIFEVGINKTGTGTIFTLQKSYDSATGPWIDVATYTADSPTSASSPNINYRYDTTTDRASMTGSNLWYRLGIKTGEYGGASSQEVWMTNRIPRLFAWSTAGYVFGQAAALPSYYINNYQDCYTAWPRMHGSLMHGDGDSDLNRGVNDRLEYCSYPGGECLFIIDRPEVVSPRAPTLNFWRLFPPAVGTEQTAEWLWDKEVVQDGTAGHIGAGFIDPTVLTHMAGKSKYIAAIKSVVYSSRPEVPAQVLRHRDWV